MFNFFYDPLFKKEYSKGFTYRKKLNKFKTVEERKAAVKYLLDEMPKLFEEKGFELYFCIIVLRE